MDRCLCSKVTVAQNYFIGVTQPELRAFNGRDIFLEFLQHHILKITLFLSFEKYPVYLSLEMPKAEGTYGCIDYELSLSAPAMSFLLAVPRYGITAHCPTRKSSIAHD